MIYDVMRRKQKNEDNKKGRCILVWGYQNARLEHTRAEKKNNKKVFDLRLCEATMGC